MTCPLYVIGSANVDHIMRLPKLPARGETVTGGTYLSTFGGKGANSAVAAAKAGGCVEFVGCLGDDHGGVTLLQKLKEYQVGTGHVRVLPGQSTGQALVMVGNEGANYLSVAPGTNHCWKRSHLSQVLKDIPAGSFVLLQNEIPWPINQIILEAAQDGLFHCLFNFAPAIAFPLEILSGLHSLIVNESEADSLLSAMGLRPTASGEPLQASAQLMSLGCHNVVITLGSRGIVYRNPEQADLIPALSVTAVDTTAAGDTFCGTFALGLAEGLSLEAACRFANQAAAISVTRHGAMISSPSREEINQALKLIAPALCP